MAIGLMSHVLVIPKSHADEIVIDDNAFTDSFVRILSNLEDSRVSAEIFSNPTSQEGGFRLPPAEGPITASNGDIYAHCVSAVALVGSIYQCGKCSKWHSRGFAGGWIASAEGHIVTNYHVLDVKKNDRIGVMMFDGRVFPVKSVCALDEVSDSAILKIDPAGEPLPSCVSEVV
jgi:S1-C subfamily serine protease